MTRKSFVPSGREKLGAIISFGIMDSLGKIGGAAKGWRFKLPAVHDAYLGLKKATSLGEGLPNNELIGIGAGLAATGIKRATRGLALDATMRRLDRQGRIPVRLSAKEKLGCIIALAADTRPRNPQGEFEGNEGEPDPRAMHVTYRGGPPPEEQDAMANLAAKLRASK